MTNHHVDLESLEQAVIDSGDVDYFRPRAVTIRALASFGPAIFIFLIVIPLINGHPIYDTRRPAVFWISLGFVLVFSTVTALFSYRRDEAWRKDPRAAAEKLKRNFDDITGPNWVRVTLKWGAVVALGTGVPMGLLLLFYPAPDHSTVAERLRSTLYFELFTWAWAIPLMFALRWVSVKTTLRFVRRRSRSRSLH